MFSFACTIQHLAQILYIIYLKKSEKVKLFSFIFRLLIKKIVTLHHLND